MAPGRRQFCHPEIAPPALGPSGQSLPADAPSRRMLLVRHRSPVNNNRASCLPSRGPRGRHILPHASYYGPPVDTLLATGTCGLYVCEGLIVKSSARQHRSIRWRNTAHPAARNALLSRPDDPMWSSVAAGCMPLAYPLPL
jgi:hypothetical protein